MAGDEDDKYMNNPNNVHIFALNTVCNYDKDVIPYLMSEVGSAYIRTGKHFKEIPFLQEKFFVHSKKQLDF